MCGHASPLHRDTHQKNKLFKHEFVKGSICNSDHKSQSCRWLCSTALLPSFRKVQTVLSWLTGIPNYSINVFLHDEVKLLSKPKVNTKISSYKWCWKWSIQRRNLTLQASSTMFNAEQVFKARALTMSLNCSDPRAMFASSTPVCLEGMLWLGH